mgnify:CR=1 FL=1
MKTAIVTLPLHTNYGGLLQAYALKSLVEQLGHQATVLDISRKISLPKAGKAPFIYLKRLLQGREVFRERRLLREYPVISAKINKFTDKYISEDLLQRLRSTNIGDSPDENIGKSIYKLRNKIVHHQGFSANIESLLTEEKWNELIGLLIDSLVELRQKILYDS